MPSACAIPVCKLVWRLAQDMHVVVPTMDTVSAGDEEDASRSKKCTICGDVKACTEVRRSRTIKPPGAGAAEVLPPVQRSDGWTPVTVHCAATGFNAGVCILRQSPTTSGKRRSTLFLRKSWCQYVVEALK